MDMGNHLILFLLLTILVNLHALMHATRSGELIFNGFSKANLKLDGQACVVSRAIRLTGGVNLTEGSAFYSKPLDFSSNSGAGGASFSTTFVFGISSDTTESPSGAPGMVFVLFSNMELLQHLYRNSVVQGQLGFSDYSSNSGDQFFFTVELSYINDDLVEIIKEHDFGLARSHDHEADVHTTRVAGTWGYIAPELARLGKATKATDVYAFGIFMLEVACGRQPIEVSAHGEPWLLADWVFNTWQTGSLTDVMDTRLELSHATEEVELVLKLGLLCSHSLPKERPCMRLVMQYLESDATLPNFSPSFFTANSSKYEGFEDQVVPSPSVATSITDLSGGR